MRVRVRGRLLRAVDFPELPCAGGADELLWRPFERVRFLPPSSLSLSGKAAPDAVRPDPTGDGA